MLILSFLNYIFFIFLIILGTFREITIKKSIKIALILIVSLSIGYVAYRYQPMVEMDLTRYFDVMAQIKTNGFFWAIHESPYKDELLFNFIFYAFAQFPNFHYLPGVITFLVYFLILAGTMKYALTNHIKNQVWFCNLCIFFSFIILRFTISGIRNQFAISVFAFFILTQKKRNPPLMTIIVCLASMFLHKSMIVFVCLYFLAYLNNYHNISWIKLLLPFWGLAIDLAVFILQKVPVHFLQLVGKTLSNYICFSDYDMRLYYTKIALIIIMLIIDIGIHRDLNKVDIKDKKLIDYFEWVLMFAIGAMPIIILFERVTHFLICICLPILSVYFFSKKIDRVQKFIIVYSLFVLICGTGAYQVWDAINHLRF